MKNITYLIRLLTGILFSLLVSQSQAQTQTDEPALVIGVLADIQPAEVQSRWQPLSEYLGQFLTNQRIQVRALPYNELEKAVQLHQVDFLLTDPSHYVRLRSRNSLSRVLATLVEQEKGKQVAAIGGAIIALKERADLVDIMDLEGRSVAILGTWGLAEYQTQAHEMIGAGMRFPENIVLQEVAGGHEEVVQEVLSGQADAGFIRAGVLEKLHRQGHLNTQRLHLLNLQKLPGFPYAVSTHLYPQWPFVALPQTDPVVARKVAAALLLFEPEKKQAQAMGIYGFSTPANYTEIDELLRELRIPPYDLLPEFTLTDVWQRYRVWLAVLVVAGVVVLLLSVFLITSNRRLKEYREQLEDLVVARTAALDGNRQRLETIIDNLPTIFFIKDVQGRYLQVNRRYEEDVGVSREQAVDHTDYEIHPSLVADGIVQLDRRVLREREPISFEERVPHADGTFHDYLTTKVPLLDETGESYALFGVATDVTQIKTLQEDLGLAKEAAESLQQMLQLVLNTIPVRVFWKDINLKYLGCNKLFAQDAGFTRPDELLGFDDFDMAWKNEAELYRVDDKKVMDNDRPLLAYEEPQTTPDGEQIWLSTSKIPLKDSNNKIVGILGTYEDITKRKQAERSIIEAKETAETATRVKSDFLANMSHEIRTPLNAVLGLAKIGLRESREVKSLQSFTHIINSGEHLLGVINDVLDFSKIEQGKLTIESRPFQLIASMENIVNIMAERARARGLQLKAHFDSELPAWVAGDALRLQQILLNLLSNAIKFTRQGEVIFSMTQDSGMTHFRVSDSGIGMNEDEISRLFNPFEQADSSTTRKYGGTGLGLTISRNLAVLMGGEINVQSEPGKGSTFILSLPLAETEAGIELHNDQATAMGSRLEGVRVLAAEDVEVNRIVLQDMLEYEGAHVVFAENGQQALDRLEKTGSSAFDIVLMDVQMPVMDGYLATRYIQRIVPALPVIGLTAHALSEERDRCLAAGMVEHVTKPINADVLVGTILRHVRPLAVEEQEEPAFHKPALSKLAVVADAPKTGDAPPDFLPGIDIDDGLKRLRGKWSSYKRLLLLFHQEYKASADRMASLLKERNFEEAALLAHSLKGISGTLGAWQFYEETRLMEEACRTVDEEAMNARLVSFRHSLEEVIDGLAVLDGA